MAVTRVVAGEQNNSDSQPFVARGGKQGEQLASELHGRYYEQTYRDHVFSGSIVGQVTTVGTNTTYTGLCLSNPISSTKNLVVLSAGYSFIVAFSAAAHIGLMTGYNVATNVTHTTAVTVRSQRFTGTTATNAVGLLDSAATLPTTPTVNLILGSGLTGAITTTPHIGPTIFDVAGQLILAPGAYCAFYTSTASGTAGGAFSFSWEEVPA
jgi:hypothetical protein